MQNSEYVRNEITANLKRNTGRDISEASIHDIYEATAAVLMNSISEKRYEYRKSVKKQEGRELFYLSFEFLMGRSLKNNLVNMGLYEVYEKALDEMGFSLEETARAESDAGLGNGGLGRLAACFMDSLAKESLPAFGCSIRYEYGLFEQKIVDGYQTELPDKWLENGSAWEIPCPDEAVTVRFGGNVIQAYENNGFKYRYEGATEVRGIPYDMPITGYGSDAVNTLRLWSARAVNELDFELFSGGDYVRAAEEKASAEALSKVLYPEDNHTEGKILRLKQQYFFASCTIQWIIKRIKKKYKDLTLIPEKTVIQINDTHPAVAIPEMMRILMDEEGMDWEQAWGIVTKTFAYTNHTIMNEALERWQESMFFQILPRIYMIVKEIDRRQREYLRSVYGNDMGKINYMAVVSDGCVSMANLCICACYAVNGVSGLHTDILRNDVFRDYCRLYPDKFHSITNGISFRRFFMEANPKLHALVQKTVGEDMQSFGEFADDENVLKAMACIKRQNKETLARYIEEKNGIQVDVNSIFDIQAKRLHEYKRQLLCVLYILYLYNEIKDGKKCTPRTFIFGAKASPGYKRAKLIIKLINSVAQLVNNDPQASRMIRVVFIENYGVSVAEIMVAAADISEQISTAGTEASGTGNMKFMLNGAVTVGTLDGANVEMLGCAGDENVLIFGMNAEQVKQERERDGMAGRKIYLHTPKIKRCVDMLVDGTLEPERPSLFKEIYDSLVIGDGRSCDRYMVLSDFESYVKVQKKAAEYFADKKDWTRRTLLGIAGAGMFSSDRTVLEYNDKVWHILSVK